MTFQRKPAALASSSCPAIELSQVGESTSPYQDAPVPSSLNPVNEMSVGGARITQHDDLEPSALPELSATSGLDSSIDSQLELTALKQEERFGSTPSIMLAVNHGYLQRAPEVTPISSVIDSHSAAANLAGKFEEKNASSNQVLTLEEKNPLVHSVAHDETLSESQVIKKSIDDLRHEIDSLINQLHPASHISNIWSDFFIAQEGHYQETFHSFHLEKVAKNDPQNKERNHLLALIKQHNSKIKELNLSSSDLSFSQEETYIRKLSR